MNPARPLPGPRVDIELQNLQRTTTETIDALAQVRRSDGKLANGVVDLAALSDEVIRKLGGAGAGSGGVIFATKAQAEAGTSDAVVMSPLRAKQAIDMFGVGSSGGGTSPSGPIAITDVIGLKTALDNKTNVSALSVLSDKIDGVAASVASIAVRAIVGAGLTTVATANGVTTVSVAAASQAQAEGGLDNATVMTPLRVAQAIAVLGANQGGSPVGPADAAAIVRTPIYFDKSSARIDSRLFASDGSAVMDAKAYKLVDLKSPFNTAYADGNFSAFHIRHVAEGTHLNGPRGAALGASISMFKEGFGTVRAKEGEIDGLYIVLRQDGPRNGQTQDGCGILIDAAVYENVGFVGGIEGATSVLSNANSQSVKQLGYQLGCIDTTTGNAIGLFLSAGKGAQTTGLRVLNYEAGGGYFANFFECDTHQGHVFHIERDGTVGIGRRFNDGNIAQSRMHLRLQTDGSLGFVNGDKSTQLLNLKQDGNLYGYAGMFGKQFQADLEVRSLGNIQAVGLITAGSAFRLTAGGYSDSSSSSWKRGTFYAGPSGKLRYCHTDGANPLFVMLSNSANY